MRRVLRNKLQSDVLYTHMERNKDRRRDEYVTSARYGFGVQRIDTLGVVVTSPTAIE